MVLFTTNFQICLDWKNKMRTIQKESKIQENPNNQNPKQKQENPKLWKERKESEPWKKEPNLYICSDRKKGLKSG